MAIKFINFNLSEYGVECEPLAMVSIDSFTCL